MFIIQHVLQSARGNRILVIMPSTPPEFVDSVEICEPLAESDHNQVQFNIKVMTNWDVDIPEILRRVIETAIENV